MVWISFDEHVFRHSWDKVVEAALRKYPNPETPNVSSTDILEREVDEDGKLISRRIISSYWSNVGTDIVRGLTGIDLSKTVHALEISVLDPKEKKYELTSKNYNFLNYITVDERLTYVPHETEPDTTLLKQEWCISVQNLGFQSYLESMMGTTMKSTASKGREGIEYVISQIKEEMEKFATPVVEEMQQLAVTTMKEFNSVQSKLEEAQKMLQEKNLQDELADFITKASSQPDRKSDFSSS
ncbi:PRELI domain containing protein 3A-like [Styela clava]|uniref:PRELI domain containing protein 3A-like n=1 Tax=Styela clava TaxID=7725 RepID=UPI001939CAB5|nr:PRELI domain containing protein 3A-like [Styela clava]